MRLQLVLRGDWHGNTGWLVAQDLALLTKVRTLIHEETALLSVRKILFPELTRSWTTEPTSHAPWTVSVTA